MNEYLIYTTEGTTIAPNEEIPVDNCQVLGRSKGEDFVQALDNLFNDNRWVEEAGFDKAKCLGVQIINGGNV